ncbi:LOW QUALITY PROTEIN: RB1-inducible coiled-coil protein 1-like [Pollicipes pollicipes]|uniref:LOW QUALITY PROTEIN: RB1-inducible coiled-coil protein 1-like n=1 Tax=Pollicipes pollicipes TaxID=41117 RepID=UPI001884BB08|nr:LOW QUALITY PROTEIN: RB1-inducible coiled-coil protein 1-like [Pollicipes pollicipes]
MLYVFLVNTGTTLTFDMQLAMQTVDVLKKKIAECCRIPPDKQVLLISGGEWLDATARVGSYPAGTDTSPIFLFSKLSEAPQMPTDPMQSSDEIEDQVAGSMALPPSYSTVVSRSQLAQQIFECGREQVRHCDLLIHEQHLQQQGWAAVVANMDDLSQVLVASSSRFSQQFQQYLSERPQHFALLDAFPEDLQLAGAHTMLEELDAAAGATRVPAGSSILDWISAQDTRRLEEVCDKAHQGLELLDEQFLQELTAEQHKILDPAMASDMSEIRGLEDRLMRLDELRHRAQTTVSEQKELAKAFIQNQARASCVNDPSVLPDLCASHCTQLQVMLDKHKQLVDVRKRCAKAKEELSANIHRRLCWVVSIQQRMTELSTKLMIHSERLKQLRQQMAVLSALHQAPTMYLTAVAEVVRRRQFTDQFLDWAGSIAASAAKVHAAESLSRHRFGDALKSHFIKGMFPGVDEVPPPFAAECPADYDARLPPLTEQHVRRLTVAGLETARLTDLQGQLESERRAAKEAHDAQLQRQAEEQRTKLILEWREVSEKQKREIEERCQRLLEAAVLVVTDRLRAEHRAEVQALRSRFRMMTSNLGSPSDGSSENLPLGSPQSEASGKQRADEACCSWSRSRRARRPMFPSVRRLQRDNERLRMQLSRSTSGLLERGQVSVLTCNDGDVVLVVWDAERRHYRVYQEATLLYFVHSDSYEALGLSAQTARRQYAVAEVVSHEFCQAKKEGNRYHVPRGTRFYRVRVKPWTRPAGLAELSGSTRRLSAHALSVESHEGAS